MNKKELCKSIKICFKIGKCPHFRTCKFVDFNSKACLNEEIASMTCGAYRTHLISKRKRKGEKK